MFENDELRALITEAQDGSVRAFELLVSAHLPQVRRFARAYAKSDADADDLAQEALVKVYRSLRSFRFQSAFKTWLYTVVRNMFLTHAQPCGPGALPGGPAAGGPRAGSLPAPSADEGLAQAEQRQRLWKALRRCRSEFRTAVVLFDVEGHTYEEVAAIEGVPVGTVKSRLSRGRGLLKALLAGEAAPDPPFSEGGAGTYEVAVSSQVQGARNE